MTSDAIEKQVEDIQEQGLSLLQELSILVLSLQVVFLLIIGSAIGGQHDLFAKLAERWLDLSGV